MRAAFPLLCILAAGCSSDRDTIEKRLSSLRDDITRLQSENDRLGERVDALEAKPPGAATPAPTPGVARAEQDTKLERPALKVVKVVPGGESDSANGTPGPEPAAEERADAPGTRPLIRLRGKEARGDDVAPRSLSAAEAR